jgi:acyl-CoA reductase-like NAD-dependent aldehyde dehydrogenase
VKVTSPATGAVIREVAADGAVEVARAHERAGRAQPAWAGRPHEE